MKELLNNWLTGVSVKVKRTTFIMYDNIIEKHIMPSMSNILVKNITLDFLNEFIAYKLEYGRLDGKGGLSSKTVINIITILKSVFKYAENAYGFNNPTKFIFLPKTEDKKIQIISDDDNQKIKEYLKAHNDYFALVYDLCIQTGIRVGELCALKCEDIDLENHILKINKTIQRINNPKNSKFKTIVIIDVPKSKSSNREIPIPDNLIEKMRKQILNKKKTDFVFSPDGVKSFDTRTIQKRFKTVLKNCHLKSLKFHVLRHTFATKWAQSNLDIKSLSEILGHKNINVTLSLYVHSSIDIKRKQINSLFPA